MTEHTIFRQNAISGDFHCSVLHLHGARERQHHRAEGHDGRCCLRTVQAVHLAISAVLPLRETPLGRRPSERFLGFQQGLLAVRLFVHDRHRHVPVHGRYRGLGLCLAGLQLGRHVHRWTVLPERIRLPKE